MHQVLKENATFISFLDACLMCFFFFLIKLVLCVECKLRVFEMVKIYIMQLFLDYWFEGEIYSS